MKPHNVLGTYHTESRVFGLLLVFLATAGLAGSILFSIPRHFSRTLLSLFVVSCRALMFQAPWISEYRGAIEKFFTFPHSNPTFLTTPDSWLNKGQFTLGGWTEKI